LKNKKLLTVMSGILLIIVLIILPFVVACAEEAPVPTPAPGPKPAPAPKAELPSVTWRCQSMFGGKEVMDCGVRGSWGDLNLVCRLVDERTDGKFKIEPLISGAVYKQPAMADAITSGAIEMVQMTGYYLAGIVPESNITPNPFFSTKSPPDSYAIWYETDWLDIAREAFAQKGIYYVGSIPAGSTNFLSNVPIRKVEDFKGLKIRASGALVTLVEALGAVPTPVAFAEQYTALQRGTIDCATGSNYCIELYKWGEVVDYLIWPPYCAPVSVDIYANLNDFNKLPEEYQKILVETVEEVGKEKVLTEITKLDAWVRDDLCPKYGVENIDLPEEEIAKMRSAVIPIWDDLASKSENCAKMIDIVKAHVGVK